MLYWEDMVDGILEQQSQRSERRASSGRKTRARRRGTAGQRASSSRRQKEPVLGIVFIIKFTYYQNYIEFFNFFEVKLL